MSFINRLLLKQKKHIQTVNKAKRKLKEQEKELQKKQQELLDNIQEQKQIQKYKNEYEHLRKQLTLVETDLKNAYERYRLSIEPEFLKRREMEFIKKKLHKLQKERTRLMSLLKREYNIRTKCNQSSYKLQQTNNEYINTQNITIDKNKENIEQMNKNIQMKDRLVSIKDYHVNDIDRKINMTIGVLVIILVCFVPIMLSFMNLISGRLALLCVFVISVFGGLFVWLTYKDVPNRSKRIWELRNFKEKEDKKVAEPIVSEETSDIDIDGETVYTIEDILADKLTESKKCL